MKFSYRCRKREGVREREKTREREGEKEGERRTFRKQIESGYCRNDRIRNSNVNDT